MAVGRLFAIYYMLMIPIIIQRRFFYDLGNKQWDIPKLRELLENILPHKAIFDDYEMEHDFADIGRRIMLLNARHGWF